MEDVKLLKQIPLFKDFKATELMNVSMVAEQVSCKAGDVIFKEGGKGDAFYVIKEGRAKVTKRDSYGEEEHVLALLEEGEYFGEISLVDHQPRSASVHADVDSKLLKIKEKNFTNLIKANKDMERKFFRSFSMVLCERLRVTNQNLTFSQEINRMIEDMEG